MIDITITERQVLQGFDAGVYCSQDVFGQIAPQIGLDRETAMKIAAPFAAGMWHGGTCGCVAGALMAIGLRYGQGEAVDRLKLDKMMAIKARFEEAFAKEYGSCVCHEILGHDLSRPEGMARIQEEGLFEKICGKAVVSACEILKEIFDNETAG
jgi:C_GCAxxG_C_C family probable redox protein